MFSSSPFTVFDNYYRPISLTVIGWYLLVGSIGSLLSLGMFANPVFGDVPLPEGMSPAYLLISGIVSTTANAVGGYTILTGRNWGRVLYIGVSAVSILVSILIFPAFRAMSVLGIGSLAVFAFFLTRPLANSYFNAEIDALKGYAHQRKHIVKARAIGKNSNSFLQIVGVGFACIAGFLMLLFTVSVAYDLQRLATTFALWTGIPTIVLLMTGVFLWGKTRWKGFFGWTLLISGGFSAMMWVTHVIMNQTDYWQNTLPDPDKFQDFMESMQLTNAISLSIGLGLLGLLLVSKQRQADIVTLREMNRGSDSSVADSDHSNAE